MLIQNITSYDDFLNYLEKYKYIFINISATWCKPCMAIKPNIEKFISVIDESEFIYLKIDNGIYDEEYQFDSFFKLKKIPYFGIIKDKKLVESFVSADFDIVSKKIFQYIVNEKKEEKYLYNDFNNNDDF
jgi:thiol-disulfide isomerase/thioredoxin